MSGDAVTRWNARARLALAAHSVGGATADTVLDEVAQHCADSGESPHDAFGSPEEFAATVVTERVPPEERLRRMGDGPTFGQALRTAAAPVGLAALAAGACIWIADGPVFPVTPAGLAGTSLIAMALAGGGLVATARNRRRRALGWGAVAAATVAAATALTALPGQPLGHLPAPLLCVLGLALLWAAIRTTPTAEPEGAIMDSGTAPLSTGEREPWLDRLPRLLEERHAIPRARAAELAEEAAGHLEATGSTPEDEFGPVELYALRLAEQEAPRAPWWKRGAVQESLFAVLLTAYLVVTLVSGGPSWQIALAGGALAVNLALLATRLPRGRRGVPPGR
ncbi:hypothetical protein ACFWP3_31205 [Streptomyces sp. NPDC058525]|uniref:hypothetical protein n=1 Tax=Streptomyces sp. NPDC058525 TaxID=3346538 RepID=UPI003656AD6D